MTSDASVASVASFMVNRAVRALGIDYGRRRIGLAISDATGMLARPLKTIARRGTPHDVADAIVREIAALDQDAEPVTAVIIGLPRRLNGEANEQTAHVNALMAALRERLRLPVIAQDERLTSHEADRLLSTAEKDWRKRKPLLDAMAAAVILQDYLDGVPRPAPVDREGEDL